MTDRVLSRHGNVIAADFRPRRASGVALTLETETLYSDGRAVLLRTVGGFAGKTAFVLHTLGDLANGRTVNL